MKNLLYCCLSLLCCSCFSSRNPVRFKSSDSKLKDLATSDELCSEKEFSTWNKEDRLNYFKVQDIFQKKSITSKEAAIKELEKELKAQSKKIRMDEDGEGLTEQEFENSYQSSLLFIFKSLSPQPGTLNFPRVVSFSPHLKAQKAGASTFIDFMYSVSGSDVDQAVEIIEYNYKHDRFCGRLILFDDNKVTYQESPSSCKKCHHEDFRPNWNPAPEWPGFFGSFAGRFHPSLNSREESVAKGFIESEVKNRSSIYKLFEIQREGSATSSNGEIPINFLSRAVLEFGENIPHMNFKRLARKLVDNDNFENMKYAYTAAVLDCRDIDSFLSETQKKRIGTSFSKVAAETRTRLKAMSDKRVESLNEFLDSKAASDLMGIPPNEDATSEVTLGIISKLRYLVDYPTGMADWSMAYTSFSQEEMDKQIAFAGNSTPISKFAPYYLEKAFTDPRDEMHSWASKYIDPAFFRNRTEIRKLCTQLKDKIKR